MARLDIRPASFRILGESWQAAPISSPDAFAHVLRSKLDVIDCTRFVVDEQVSQRYRELPYATLRYCMLAAEHFDADYLIAVATLPHQAFYRWAFDYRLISGPRTDPDVATPARLMVLKYPTAADDLYR